MRNGNLDGIEDPDRPTLYLGFASNHYQSLLPAQNYEIGNEDASEIPLPSECPACGKSSKRILTHMSMAKACKEIIGEEMLATWRKRSNKKSHSKYQAKYVESGKHDEAQRRYVVSGKHALVQAKHWEMKMSQNKDECQGSLRKRQRKWKISRDENFRNRNFLEATKYGPIFICICCHRKLSRCTVTPFTEALQQKFHSFIYDLNVFTNIMELKDGQEVTPNSR